MTQEWTEGMIADWGAHVAHVCRESVYFMEKVDRRSNGVWEITFLALKKKGLRQLNAIRYADRPMKSCVIIREPTDEELVRIAAWKLAGVE